jgi:hypothetical protein
MMYCYIVLVSLVGSLFKLFRAPQPGLRGFATLAFGGLEREREREREKGPLEANRQRIDF